MSPRLEIKNEDFLFNALFGLQMNFKCVFFFNYIRKNELSHPNALISYDN